MTRPKRSIPWWTPALLAGSVASRVAHADTIDECIDASDRAQVSRDAGALLAARELFVRCARAECPALLQRDCAEWLAAVEGRIPSVVPRARDSAGRDVVDAAVTIDGRPIPDWFDGRAIALDPGQHTVRWEHPRSPPVEQRFLLREGEKGRPIDAVLEIASGAEQKTSRHDSPARAAPPQAVSQPSIPSGAIVLGGIGAAGLAGFVYFGVSARQRRNELAESCAPSCDQSEVDDVRRRVVFANVALGIGSAAFAGAAWLVIAARDDGDSAGVGTSVAQNGALPAAARAVRIGLQPRNNGGFALIRTSF